MSGTDSFWNIQHLSMKQSKDKIKLKIMRVGSSILALLGVTSSAFAFNVQPSVLSPTNAASKSAQSALRMSESNMEGFAASASSEFETLGLPARPGRPLKVAIAGGGVGGLTCALCMLKKGFDVTVYEKTEAFQRFGGPIQFASNALSVLKEIDDTLFDRVMEKFTFTGTRTCGIKDGKFQWTLHSENDKSYVLPSSFSHFPLFKH